MKAILKRTLSLLLCAALLLQAAPWSLAADALDGTFTYAVNADGTASITGYSDSEAEELVIPDTIDGLTVTTIADSAFANRSALTAVTFPATLTAIGPSAFSNCDGLTVIDLPEGLTTLGNRAFAYMDGELTVTIPQSLTKAEIFGPFQYSNIQTVQFREGVTTIIDNLFYCVEALPAITLPEALTEIGASAFSGCKALQTIDIPDSVSVIGEDAFSNCTGLQTVRFPAGLQTIGSSAFSNCTGLTALSLPEGLRSIGESAFYGCNGLSEIVLPEGLTYLGNRAFAYIDSALSVTIPKSLQAADGFGPFQYSNIQAVQFREGVTKVADRLFYCVETLQTLVLPETVTEIGDYAFSNCTNLQSITLPEGLTVIGDNAFESCKQLTAILLPEGLRTIGSAAFFYCSGLTNLELPEGLQVLDDRAFAYCAGLKEVTIPDGLQEMGSQVFQYCDSLERVFCGSAKPTIAGWYTNTCPATIHANKDSTFVLHAIDNSIPLEVTGYEMSHNDLDSSRCGIRTTTSNGMIYVTLNYAVRDPAVDSGTMVCRLPEAAVLWEAFGVTLNGAVTTHRYDLEDRLLTIQLNGADSGTIRFTLEPKGSGAMNLYARFSGYRSGAILETVDVLLEDMPAVTINAPERVSDTFRVSGIAGANETVTICVQGGAARTAAANAIGYWAAEVTLPDPEELAAYTVTATVPGGSAATEVRYQQLTPELKSLRMYYNDHDSAVVDLVTNENPVLPFDPSYPLTFVASFENDDAIEQVFITATHGGDKRSMEALYDAKTDSYIATGTFGNTGTYVPGAIGVEYTLKDSDFSVSQAEAAMTELIETLMQSDALNDFVVIKEEAPSPQFSAVGIYGGPVKISSTAAKIRMPAVGMADTSVSVIMEIYQVTDSVSIQMNPVIPIGMQLTGARGVTNCYRTDNDPLSMENVTVSSDGQWLRFTTTDSETGETYHISCNASDAGKDLQSFAITVEKASGDEVIRFFVSDLGGGKAEKILESLDGVGDAAKLLELILEANDIQSDYDEMVREIYRTVPPEQQKEALREARRVRNGRSDYMVGTIALAAMTKYMVAAGLTTGPAGAIAVGLMLALALSAEEFSKYAPESESLLSKLFNLHMVVDPSGYVYEGVTTNRVEGVTTTAYWIPEDPENPNFWDTAPTAEVTDDGVLCWNAADYNQINPLTTDSQGRYAWDVPAGWWKVAYEKTGYETVCSDWLPVPPPQLEVNIPLVSTEAPELEAVEAENGTVLVTFTQYMDPETVAEALTLNGSGAGFTVTWPTDETDVKGTVFARTFTLMPADLLADNETVTVAVSAAAENYAGRAALSGSRTTTVGCAPKLDVPATLNVYYGETVTLPVTVANVTDPQVTLRSQLSAIASVDGDAITGNLPGVTTVTVAVAGTHLTKTVEVQVLFRPITIFAVSMTTTPTADGVAVTASLNNSTESDVTETYVLAAYGDGQQMLDSVLFLNRTTAALTTEQLTHTFPAETTDIKLFRLDDQFRPVTAAVSP